ncbi:MAG: glycosyltransferase [Verrucomicrobia bacterium]|nr:glycosyltransferase [Verrucomicrobiota bacterium]
MARYRVTQIEDYQPLVGAEVIERIRAKAAKLKGLRVAHFNSTYYGGGVAEIISSLTLLMNSLGLRTEWRVIQGRSDFFSITKKMHNALQGGKIDLSSIKKEIFEQVIYENSLRNFLDHDFVIVHDPQPLPLIEHYQKKWPWLWRCHLDLSRPDAETWKYLRGWIDNYDMAILSCKEFAQEMTPQQRIMMPAINPFTIKNRPLSDREIDERLAHYDIPADLPLIVQVSRFDPWKDPKGVVDAFKLTRKQIDARLVLLGNFATDDPEGEEIFRSLCACRDDRIQILTSGDDTALVNALQTRAAVVLQKSLREGFGLTVAEAMWKGTPVIGGNVGGIRYQIENGVNGFLVSSIEETAERMVELINDKKLRNEMGGKARETVRKNFLLTRYVEQYLDLFGEL